MEFDKMHAARLTALADHLGNEPLKLDNFRFSVIYLQDARELITEKNMCGSVGCALGEASLMWPDFEVNTQSWTDTAQRATEFFGLSDFEVDHLFNFGDGQDCERYGGVPLTAKATPQQVASNIRAFLEIKALDNC